MTSDERSRFLCHYLHFVSNDASWMYSVNPDWMELPLGGLWLLEIVNS